MSDDDRFGLDAPEPAPSPQRRRTLEPRPQRSRSGSRRTGAVVLVAIAALLVVVSLNTLRTEGRGARGLAPGTPVPAFAVPLALSDLEGDANLATERGQDELGEVPACEVRGPDVLNGCDVTRRPGPAVLAFYAERGGDCAPALDRLDRVSEDFPRLEVAAIAVRGDRERLRRTIREHRWDFPVGYDRDGAVANRFSIAVCPHLVLTRDGRVVDQVIGPVTDQQLHARLRALTGRG